MLPFLKNKPPPLLGIDISGSAIKLLELGRTGNRFRVESYAVVPIPPTAVVDRVINEVSVVGEAIARAVEKSGTKLTHAAVAVAGPSVITKLISISENLKSDDDIENQIQLEAEQYIPFPLDEVAMDFDVVGKNAETGKTDVILAAAKQDTIDTCIAAIEISGLTPKVVDIEALVQELILELMLKEQYPEMGSKVLAVADVGANVTTFNVIQNMKTIYSREQMFGGAQLTDRIQQQYGLTYAEAGKAKRVRELLPESYEEDVFNPFKDELAMQVSRATQFFYSSSAVDKIDHLLLAGGCASIEGIDQLVSEKLGVPTSIANPLANMTVSSRVSVKNLKQDAPCLLIASGLALRGF